MSPLPRLILLFGPLKKISRMPETPEVNGFVETVNAKKGVFDDESEPEDEVEPDEDESELEEDESEAEVEELTAETVELPAREEVSAVEGATKSESTESTVNAVPSPDECKFRLIV